MDKKLDELKNTFCDFNKIEKFIEKISNKNATILITGKSGSGKSRLAKIIHENSNRKEKSFVEVHCTTIPSHLLESELFGHVKGAFTGAIENKLGKVQAADGGTLFLDEIGELALESQAKLLRLIQDKVICRVGSNNDIHVNTRIILATNRDLKKMVRNNQFREDLYYRINMFECSLPCIKGNKKQILQFIKFFIKENSQDKSYQIPKPLLDILINYSWPGNIRELKNVIERLCFLTDNEVLNQQDLPEYILTSKKNNPEAFPSCAAPVINAFSSKKTMTLKELEKNYILSVIKQEPNYDKAAEILGITKVTLWRKRKEYNERPLVQGP